MGEWSYGLFGCFDNCGLCIWSYFCPCIVFGETAEKVGEDCCKCGFCIMCPIGNIISWLKIREKVRESKGIEGSCCNDFLCLWFCGICALIQTAAEVGVRTSGGQAMVREQNARQDMCLARVEKVWSFWGRPIDNRGGILNFQPFQRINSGATTFKIYMQTAETVIFSAGVHYILKGQKQGRPLLCVFLFLTPVNAPPNNFILNRKSEVCM